MHLDSEMWPNQSRAMPCTYRCCRTLEKRGVGGGDIASDMYSEEVGWCQGLVPKHCHAVSSCDKYLSVWLQVGKLHGTSLF